MTSAIGATRAAGVCLALGLALSACGATKAGDVFGNLLAFNSPQAPPIATAAPVVQVDCPTVSVDDSGGTLRVFAGADHSNESVKYQLGIAQYARECHVENGQLAIKVGVQGRLLIGPAGTSGSYVAPVRIAIERQSDNKVVAQQIYRTAVAVPAGTGETLFETISEPLVVPFTGQHADAAYTIVVGFQDAAAPHAPGKPKRGRRRG